jgi:hypothetical protein
MLGGDAVGERQRLVRSFRQDDRAEIAPARGGGLGARQRFSWRSTAAVRPLRPKAASSVIRIDCAPVSCSAWASRSAAIQSGSLSSVGDDQHFRRAGDHVDADRAEDLALGGRDIGVARPDDLGHRPDRLGAVGERRDGLRAADAVDFRHAGKIRAATSTSGLMRRRAPAPP